MQTDNLTLGEVAAVENLTGLSIEAAGDETAPKGKLMAALAYVFRRRTDPTFTFEDALGLTVVEANAILGVNVADPSE